MKKKKFSKSSSEARQKNKSKDSTSLRRKRTGQQKLDGISETIHEKDLFCEKCGQSMTDAIDEVDIVDASISWNDQQMDIVRTRDETFVLLKCRNKVLKRLLWLAVVLATALGGWLKKVGNL